MSELAQKLIQKEKQERTGKLDLGRCGLTDIPEEVFELTWLEGLSFCNQIHYKNKKEWIKNNSAAKNNSINIETFPYKFKNLSNLKELYYGGELNTNDYSIISRWSLKNCSILSNFEKLELLYLANTRINTIDPLENLTNLKSLNISGNDLSDIKTLENLNNLTKLYLSTNVIFDIETLKHLDNLIKLNLSSNQISNIKPLKNLNNLKEINFWDNKISDIRTLGNLNNLTVIDLSSNQISDIKPLKNLNKLEKIDLGWNQISDIKPLESLKKLQYLKLSFNQISDIKQIENMKNLMVIDLSTNQINDIKPLKNLRNLKMLGLYNNQISDIKPLESLNNLTVIDLSSNRISNIKPLKNLNKLEKIDLGWNQVSDIKPLENMKNLKKLNLRKNQVSDISPILHLIKSGQTIGMGPEYNINIENNHIEKPPISIIEKGREAVINWFEQLEEGKEPLYESKLMILGQPGAGKTTLAKLFQDETYEVKPGKERSTLGIKIHEGKEFKHRKLKEQKIIAHLWDFGGQDIQKMLHQFFITENCLYILVSDKRAENTNFNYWFQIINLFGPDSSVIVLENPKDIESNPKDFALTKYRGLYPKLDISRHQIDLSKIQKEDKAEWKALISDIEKKLSDLEIVNREVPQKWTLVRDELQKLKENENKKHISKDKFYSICSKEKINLTREQSDLCLYYLKSLGDLVYFDERGLSNCLLLDHNWLTEGMYYILADKKIKENKGVFTRKQAYKHWNNNKNNEYNENEKEMLLNLLLKDKFDICYELKQKKDTFITPLLLPDDKPEKWELKTNLHFRFQYGFFPHGMFSRLIVRLHNKIDGEKRWRTGVRLIDSNNGQKVRAEVQKITDPDTNQKVIDIKISGAKDAIKKMLDYIRTEIRPLHKEFSNLSVKEMVSCNCDICKKLMQNGKKPSFYNYKKLQDKLKKGKYWEECPKADYEKINIGKILNDIIIEDSAKKSQDSELLYELKEMGMSLNQIINKNVITEPDYSRNEKTETQIKLEKMQEEKIDERFKSWQRWGKISLASAIVLFIFGICEFLPAYKWNIAGQLVEWLKSIGSDDPLFAISIGINITVLTTFFLLFLKVSFSRLWDNQNKRKVRNEIRDEIMED